MKKIYVLVLGVFVLNAVDAASIGRTGRNVVSLGGENLSQYRNATGESVSAENTADVLKQNIENISVVKENVIPNISDVDPELEEIKKLRQICLSNNIGVGNTFVWAARNANTADYMTMIEDIQNPKNNTCYVKVDIKTSDDRIDVSDVKSKYFEMGRSVVCGSWVDEDELKQRILDGKKKIRNWEIAASVVGGVGVGVGAMELFGNKMIGGKVMGQKALEGQDLILSQLKVLEKENPTEYKRVLNALEKLEQNCGNGALWDGNKPSDCDMTINPFIGLVEKLK